MRGWIEWQRRVRKPESAALLGMLLWGYGGAPSATLVEVERTTRSAAARRALKGELS